MDRSALRLLAAESNDDSVVILSKHIPLVADFSTHAYLFVIAYRICVLMKSALP